VQLPDELDAASGRQLGNLAQAFSRLVPVEPSARIIVAEPPDELG
jgi:hypothetical protein